MSEVQTDEEKMLGLPVRPRYALSTYLYARLLGIVLFVAFASFWAQVDGLMGENGVAPAAELVDRLQQASDLGFFDHPTLAWWIGGGDTALHGLCALGVFASFLLTLGVLPRLSVLAAWAAYLSLVNIGFPFSAFQWDTLLLETCLCSVLVLRFVRFDDPRERWEPEPIARWVMYALLFRLMFRSGLVKLHSGDPTWADLSALNYHYETQPLPTLLGWYAHQLPDWLQSLSVLGTFGVELFVPLLLLVPLRWARRTAAGAFVALMLVIFLTGNYGFFNILTAVLCVPLLDDALLSRALPTSWHDRLEEPNPAGERKRGPWAHAVVLGTAGLLLFFGTTRLLGGDAFLQRIDPFLSVNDYGLFAVMTTERPEIVIEGSMDGQTWEAYGFHYKPGDLDRPPQWNTPHQPRLDWQMWFAALGTYRHNPWLIRLEQRLLEAEPSVLELLAHDPFDGEPPRYVRAVVYNYQFTSLSERGQTGAWWKRGEPRPYTPVLGR